MELLVGGSLIDLSLPVAAVYTRHWAAEGSGGRGSAGGRRGGAMAVTFRCVVRSQADGNQHLHHCSLRRT